MRLDRFFRNVYDYHKMMNEYLTPNKCGWSAVKEEYSTETTNGRLMINLRLAIAEQECDTDSDRIKDVLDNRVAQGFVNTGSVPYGLKIVDKRLVKDPETNHIVKDVFESMEQLNSIKKVMLYINEKYNEHFLYDRIYNMLKKPLYYGSYRNIDNYCEPTISKELFDRIQQRMSMNIRARKNSYEYIFSGLLKCHECGLRMVGNTFMRPTKTYTYYRCNRNKLDRLCSNNLKINEKNIEEYLLNTIEEKIKEHILTLKLSENKSPVKSNRKQIENKLLRLNDLYINGFIDMQKYKADYVALEAQIIDPIENEKRDISHLEEFINSDFISMYPIFSKEEKQAIWRSIIKEIWVSQNEVKDIVFI